MEHSKFFPPCFHRVSIKGLCVRGGKVLMVLEPKKMSGKWELPGGGLDFGEDIKEALRREIKEEVGLTVTSISDMPVYIWTHRYEANIRNIGWYYSLVLAYKIEVEDLNFTPSPECEAIRFFSKEELANFEIINEQSIELAQFFNPEDFR